jgi:ABC-type dipeptide/oligopeptide/nickel transport system permease subunit
MSKATVTRLFFGAIVALIVGFVVALAAVAAAIAGGAVALGGPEFVRLDGVVFAESLPWLLLAVLFVTSGTLAAVGSWIGALLNTWQLEDKTWFVVLLVLGLVSFGWVAMAAYVFAGPDTASPGVARSGPATTSGT